MFDFYGPNLFDSKTHENFGVNKEIVGADTYSYFIKSVAIIGSKIIVQVKDEDTEYIKVFSYMSKNVVLYIETDNALISGDKQYIWLIKENQVYDIINGLSTFFLWPGD